MEFVQQNADRWGRFTASTMSDLMTEPRSKADREAGKFGATAMSLIRQKAVERVEKRAMHVHADFSMKRGTLLEHPMIELLSEYWEPLDGCSWHAFGTNMGATPDALRRIGAPVDTKCPQSEVALYEFGEQVKDGDFESLMSWNKKYAWQIATQALVTGATQASLVYCTDKLQWIPLTPDRIQLANELMEAIGYKLFDITGQIYEYRWDTSNGLGFAFVARTFEIPDTAFRQIEEATQRAEIECVNAVYRHSKLKNILNQKPQQK